MFTIFIENHITSEIHLISLSFVIGMNSMTSPSFNKSNMVRTSLFLPIIIGKLYQIELQSEITIYKKIKF